MTDLRPMKVSYSILAAWDRGDWDRAVAPFIGGEVEETEIMAHGKKLHTRWEKETRRTRKTPAIFGAEELVGQSMEFDTKRVVQLNDWLWLSGLLDRIDTPAWIKDGKRGTDYKRSIYTATSWANSKQASAYQILYPELKVFEFQVFNPFLKKDDPDRVTMSIVHLTDQTLETGIEWILTNASQLRDYLITNGFDKNLMRERK